MRSFVSSFVLIAALVLANVAVAPVSAKVRRAPAGSAADGAELERIAGKAARSWNEASIRRSLDLFVQAGSEWKAAGEPGRAIDCLHKAARASLILSDYRGAHALLDQAVSIGKDRNVLDRLPETYALISETARLAGDAAASKRFADAAVKASKGASTPRSAVAASLAQAEHEFYYGNAATARDQFSQLVPAAREVDEYRLTASVLLRYAYTIARQDDPSAALEPLERSMSLSAQAGDDRGRALAYVAMGFVYFLLNEHDKALEYYRSAEGLFPNDVDHLDRGRLFKGLSAVHERYGDLALAIKYSRMALQSYESAGYPLGEISTLINLGQMSRTAGDTAAAEITLTDAARRARAHGDRFDVAVASESLGHVWLDRNEFDRSIASYRRSLAIYRQLGPIPSSILTSLGKAYLATNKPADAARELQAALNISRKLADRDAESENLYQLARLDAAAGRIEPALENLKASLDITDKLYYDSLNLEVKRNLVASVFERWEMYIKLSVEQGAASASPAEFAARSLTAVEETKSRQVLEGLEADAADPTRDADPFLLEREKELSGALNGAADKLTALLRLDTYDDSAVDALRNEIRELEVRLGEVRAGIKQNGRAASTTARPVPFDLADFRSRVLDNETVCLEYFLGTDASYLWLIEQDNVRTYLLPPKAAIEASVAELTSNLINKELMAGESLDDYQARMRGQSDRVNTAIAALSKDLLGQLGPELRGKHLIVIPDGTLYALPFSLLALPSESEPAVVTNRISYAPSASMLLFVAKKVSDRQAPPPKDLLVFADPVYQAGDPRVAGNAGAASETGAHLGQFRAAEDLENLPRLTGSLKESESLLAIVGGNSTSMSGFDASRINAQGQLPVDYKILHFATHALVDGRYPEVSGLVLSRFNSDGQPTQGLVRLQDIYQMQLSCDLVVLSACQTAIGKEVKGQGPMSLNNAFLRAGARAVVSSLWKVDDRATQLFMERFYRNVIESGMTVSEALQRSQIEMRSDPEYSAPFYWAAFVQHGDFRDRPQISRGSISGTLWLVIGVGSVLGALLFFMRRRIIARK